MQNWKFSLGCEKSQVYSSPLIQILFEMKYFLLVFVESLGRLLFFPDTRTLLLAIIEK